MIGFILWSVLLIQLTTGSPVVSRSISCRRCKGAEISQNVLKEGLAVTSDEMVSVHNYNRLLFIHYA